MDNARRLAEIARVRGLARSGAARSIRLAAGVRLIEVARAIDLAPATLYRIEIGERPVSERYALEYLAILDDLVKPSTRAR